MSPAPAGIRGRGGPPGPVRGTGPPRPPRLPGPGRATARGSPGTRRVGGSGIARRGGGQGALSPPPPISHRRGREPQLGATAADRNDAAALTPPRWLGAAGGRVRAAASGRRLAAHAPDILHAGMQRSGGFDGRRRSDVDDWFCRTCSRLHGVAARLPPIELKTSDS